MTLLGDADKPHIKESHEYLLNAVCKLDFQSFASSDTQYTSAPNQTLHPKGTLKACHKARIQECFIRSRRKYTGSLSELEACSRFQRLTHFLNTEDPQIAHFQDIVAHE